MDKEKDLKSRLMIFHQEVLEKALSLNAGHLVVLKREMKDLSEFLNQKLYKENEE